MKEGFGEIMRLEETAKYFKMAREGKIPAVKIESGSGININNFSAIKNLLDSLLKGGKT